ncbi:WG repeat-containing protein [Clostridium sp.]|uniref:WG repeat-containing protein n=1 Tax=Clostridium sp. TaxID=1506 RepID=UPI003F3110FE
MKKSKKHIENLGGNNCIVDLYPAQVNTKDGKEYGYINSKGGFVIKPRFSNAYDFNEHKIAIVCENNYFGAININGSYAIPPIYNYIDDFHEGRAVYTKNNTMGVISENGTVITKRNYSFISSYSDSRAVVSIIDKAGNSLYGYIDLNGNEVIPPKYKQATDFKYQHALIQDNDDLYKVIDSNGNVSNTFPYKYVGNFGEGLYTFSEELNGPLGYVSWNGEILIKPRFSYASPMEDGYMIVSESKDYPYDYGVINLFDHTIYHNVFNKINYLGNKRFSLGLPLNKDEPFANNIFAIGDGKGNRLTDFKYLDVSRYVNGVASSYDNKDTFFIDTKGITVSTLPIIKGSGTLTQKCNLIYADIDYFPSYLSPSGDVIYKPNTKIVLDKNYSVFSLKYKPNVNYLVFYPQVNGVKSQEALDNINLTLRKLSNLKKINEDELLDYSLYGNFEVLFFNKNLFIPNINTYNYPFGAAHGMTLRSTPSIDLETGEFYTLSRLFKEDSNWINEINSIISTMIATNPDYSYVYPDGFKGININQSFYVDKDNLYIYFPPYDIAPYAAGFVTFKIPFKTIDNIINKDGKFYNSFN